MADDDVKVVILVGGPEKGTRFRPLSFDYPKPIFPVAGKPVLYHVIEACKAIKNLSQVIIVGWFSNDDMSDFIRETMDELNINIRYLPEFEPMGSAGSLYHFRDQLMYPLSSNIIVINGDVCADFDLPGLLEFHNSLGKSSVITTLATRAEKEESLKFGCMVEDVKTHKALHYTNKPSTYVSDLISCGVYVMKTNIFQVMSDLVKHFAMGDYKRPIGSPMRKRDTQTSPYLTFEHDVLPEAARRGIMYVSQTSRWWSQVKTAASTIYVNRHYLKLYHKSKSHMLASQENVEFKIQGDVYIHPTAKIHPAAVIGPNVSIGMNVEVGAGARIRESIVLKNSIIAEHSCVLYSIIGWNCRVGKWTRIEGYPNDPDPNKPYAKLDHLPMFTDSGKLIPSITILGGDVEAPDETVVLNSIVLPHKSLACSCKNQIMF